MKRKDKVWCASLTSSFYFVFLHCLSTLSFRSRRQRPPLRTRLVSSVSSRIWSWKSRSAVLLSQPPTTPAHQVRRFLHPFGMAKPDFAAALEVPFHCRPRRGHVAVMLTQIHASATLLVRASPIQTRAGRISAREGRCRPKSDFLSIGVRNGKGRTS